MPRRRNPFYVLKQKSKNRFAGEELVYAVVWNVHTTDLQIKPVRTATVPGRPVVGLPTQPNLDRGASNLGINGKLFDCFKLRQHWLSPVRGGKVRKAP